MTPDRIRREITWADIRRMKEARRERERVEAYRSNVATGTLIWRISSILGKPKMKMEDMAKACARHLDEMQFPVVHKYDDEGRRIVTMAELEAQQDRVNANNVAVCKLIAGA